MILAHCDLALYLSFSESWGQVITECIAMGIPCLCSDNNGIFDNNEILSGFLVVSANDNPKLIAQQIEKVLEGRHTLGPILKQQVLWLNQKAEELKGVFLVS
jgi:glycosyltransferase involved in cell wall biosynthesis